MKRYFIKQKEIARILQVMPLEIQAFLTERVSGKKGVEKVEAEEFEIYLLDSQPIIVKTVDGKFFPPLTFSEALNAMPKIVVDQGAVPYLCKGADVMRPGIVNIKGRFKTNSLLVIAEERFNKPVAIGLSLISDEEMRLLKQGKVVENIHFVGDRIWSFIRDLKKE